jgi:hypothetical protein
MAEAENLLITDWGTEISRGQREYYEKHDLSYAELRKSANCSHDRIRRLTDTNNQLVARIIDLQAKLDRANLKIWIMSLVVSPIIAAVLKAMWTAIFR